jgi:hypothetical protein
MAEKDSFQHLTEYTNGRISIGRMLKWPNPEQVDRNERAWVEFHMLWIRPISLCNRLAKKGLQGSVENFYSF